MEVDFGQNGLTFMAVIFTVNNKMEDIFTHFRVAKIYWDKNRFNLDIVWYSSSKRFIIPVYIYAC